MYWWEHSNLRSEFTMATLLHLLYCLKHTKKPCSLTFVTIAESPLFPSLDVGHPQVVVVDEGDEVRFSSRDLRVHAGPRALCLYLHRLHRGRLLKPAHTLSAIWWTLDDTVRFMLMYCHGVVQFRHEFSSPSTLLLYKIFKVQQIANYT